MFTKDFTVIVKLHCDNMSKVKLFSLKLFTFTINAHTPVREKRARILITRINWNVLTDPVLQSSAFLSILLSAGNNGGQLDVALCGFCEALAFEAIRN